MPLTCGNRRTAVKYIKWEEYEEDLKKKDPVYVPADVDGGYKALFSALRTDTSARVGELKNQLYRYVPVDTHGEIAGLTKGDVFALSDIICAAKLLDRIFLEQRNSHNRGHQESIRVSAGVWFSEGDSLIASLQLLLHCARICGSNNTCKQASKLSSTESIPCAFVFVGMEKYVSPNLQIPGQEDWDGTGPDPRANGYMSGYYPNFCYPYPPPFASYGPMYMGVQPMYMPMMGVSYFVPSSHDHHQYEPISKASSKSRPTKRRVLEQQQEEPQLSCSSDPNPAGGALPALLPENPETGNSPATASARQGIRSLGSKDLKFVLAKQLRPSGVNSLGRIVLPKKEAEAHLPHLVASEGVLLTMADFDTRRSWTFRYRFWSNNRSRMYLLENTRDFVKAHNLQERDMLVLYKDTDGSYVIRGEKDGTNLLLCDTSGDIGAVEELTEEEISRKEQTLDFFTDSVQ